MAPRATRFIRKRAPDNRPEWLRTVTLSFPSGRTAEEIVVDDAPGLAWVVNLGCIELHPHAVRASDLDHPDELRIDLDPGPGVEWDDVRRVAMSARALLEEWGCAAGRRPAARAACTSSAHRAAWTFTRCVARALRFSREIERRAPTWRRRSGGRKSDAASFSTTTRTPRTARPALRIRFARSRRARLRAAHVG
jgi:DNA primase